MWVVPIFCRCTAAPSATARIIRARNDTARRQAELSTWLKSPLPVRGRPIRQSAGPLASGLQTFGWPVRIKVRSDTAGRAVPLQLFYD
jgi:hypothetical protein